jgi:hypothetical protein
VRFLLFDNGSHRLDWSGVPYSRLVEYELDEDTMLATERFVYGDQEGTDSFYSPKQGDVNRIRDGSSVMYCTPGPYPTVAEVSMLDGTNRWSASFESTTGFFRVAWLPSLYDTTWWYRVER